MSYSKLHMAHAAPFHPLVSTSAFVMAAMACAAPASAQTPPEHAAELAPVVVTGNPLGSSLLDLVSPTSIVSQREISLRGSTTLGDALADVPGVSATNFGPNASRPVIRGMDADRIKIMQNGVGLLDASALSPDHATPIDPLVIEQIEVVRGAAALMYGGSAVGGVVNAIDNRIPQEAITGISGRGDARTGGSDHQNSSSAVLEAGNGTFALHADGFQRTTADLSIPGYARSARLRAQSPQADEPRGRLRNSGSSTNGAALGGSLTFGSGYAGLSFANYNSDYGTVAEEDVRIRMQSERWDFASEIRDLGTIIDKVKLRFAHSDYEHRELEAGTVASTFRNRGNEGQIEATHAKLGALSGVLGLQFSQSSFGVTGTEALLPSVRSASKAVYVFEELALSKGKLTFGGRVERSNADSAGGAKFGDPLQRSFTPKSGAVGGLYPLGGALSLTGNLSHTERAPSYNELFANGSHPATGQYEIGDQGLGLEKSNGLDMQLRWKQGAHSASIGAFYTRFQNYIALLNTGNTRGADGELNPIDADNNNEADGSGEKISPEARMRGVPARFSGLEAESKLHVYEGVGDLDLKLKADYVRATNLATSQSLPRISPLSLGLGLEYRLGKFGAQLDTRYGAQQNRVAANELPTDSYVLVNALLSYRLSNAPQAELFLKGTNLLNEEVRLHSSVLKDRAPLGGRAAMIGVRASF